ncbi:hypothetical protein ACP70R_037630 [Stipagrostis hirtigluma subsp. patula]
MVDLQLHAAVPPAAVNALPKIAGQSRPCRRGVAGYHRRPFGLHAERVHMPHGDCHAGESCLQGRASAAAERALQGAPRVQRHGERRRRRGGTCQAEPGVGHGFHGELDVPEGWRGDEEDVAQKSCHGDAQDEYQASPEAVDVIAIGTGEESFWIHPHVVVTTLVRSEEQARERHRVWRPQATTQAPTLKLAVDRPLVGFSFACASAVPLIALFIPLPVREDPSFSVKVTDAHGLEPTRSPVIRPAFNLTLRVDNEQDFRACREEVTATVFYGGTVVVGWAEVPDFCVDRWSSAELNVPLSHADVLLTDGLRRRVAAELRSGELELGVEMRMVFPRRLLPCDECHESRSRQTLQLCSVKPGKGYAPCLRLFLR